MVKAVVETGKPTVVLLINGRPLSINYIAENVPAILEGFYLGEEGGTAAAHVLFGDVNPGGKLPITFPHSVGDLPDFYNHKPSDNRSYAFTTRQPLFPFGYGLSYTTFKFDNLRVEPKQIETGGTAKVSVDVTNTGSRDGDEVPQLYVHQEIASVTRPVMQLRGFERITLKPGEKRTVKFTVDPEDLSMLNATCTPLSSPASLTSWSAPAPPKPKPFTSTSAHPASLPKPPLPPPPAGSESGVVSTFDDGKAVSELRHVGARLRLHAGRQIPFRHRRRRARRRRLQRRPPGYRRSRLRQSISLRRSHVHAGSASHGARQPIL